MIPSGVKVFLASHPIDFRKGPDSLLSLVRDAGSDPFNGALYVFRAKRADRVKIVWWDGSGVCLYAKRLEKAQFCWPRIGHHRVQLNHAQLLALVDGMDWKRVRSTPVKPPEIVNRCGEVNQVPETMGGARQNML
jgi:transposase